MPEKIAIIGSGFLGMTLALRLANAGAEWVDREVVEDGNLITSRKPDDIPAFVNRLIGALEETMSPHGS